MENEVMKKNNKGLYAIIAILCIAVLGLGGFIVYDKFIKEDKKEEKECSCTKCDIKENTSTKETTTTECPELSAFDTNKAINGSDDTKYELLENSNASSATGLSATVEQDKKSVSLFVDWTRFGQYVGIEATEKTKTYNIKFDKEIKALLFSTYGQDGSHEMLFALLEDGTVAYVPVCKVFRDAKKIDISLSSKPIEGVKDVVRIAVGGSEPTCEACVGGGIETFAIKKDGTFYVLNNIITEY